MFLTLPHCPVEAKVVGKRVNCRGGYGLEIPVRYYFLCPVKAIDWLKTKLETAEKELECIMFLNVWNKETCQNWILFLSFVFSLLSAI